MMQRRARAIGVAAITVMAVLSLTAGCGSKSTPSTASTGGATATTQADQTSSTAAPAAGDAGAAAKQILDLKASGQQGAAWDLLVSQQQAVVPRATFITCGNAAAITIKSVDVKAAKPEQVQLAGTNVTVGSTAVTLDVAYSAGGQDGQETFAVHLVDVDGTWRWIADQAQITKCTGG